MLTAIVKNPLVIHIMRGELRVGSVQQTRHDGTWTSLAMSAASRGSRKGHTTPAQAAQARWGAAGRKAVERAVLVGEYMTILKDAYPNESERRRVAEGCADEFDAGIV